MFSCGSSLVLVCSSCWETFPISCCSQGILCKSSPDFFTASVLLNAFVNIGFSFNLLVSVFVFSHLQFCSFFACTSEGLFSSYSNVCLHPYISNQHWFIYWGSVKAVVQSISDEISAVPSSIWVRSTLLGAFWQNISLFQNFIITVVLVH